MSDERRAANSACPDCHVGMLLERTNRTTGNKFLGCSEWPKCKYTCGVKKSTAHILLPKGSKSLVTPRIRTTTSTPFSEVYLDEVVDAEFPEVASPADAKEIRELVDGPPPEVLMQDLLLQMTRVLQEIDARLSIVEDKLGLSDSLETPSTADGPRLTMPPKSWVEAKTSAGVHLGYCVGPHAQADICSPFEPHAARPDCKGWTECTEEDMRRVVSLITGPPMTR